MTRKKTAVVLFNLGGPLKSEDVQPFLFNLFSDSAIINLPTILRIPLAWFISTRRAPIAKEIYHNLGGKSPLLENTQIQATALEKKLSSYGDFKTFIAMRYWHPMTEQCFEQVKIWQPDKVILLPLYPQFSTTTSESSLKEWYKFSANRWKSKEICCYPNNEYLATAQADLVQQLLTKKKLSVDNTRILFSAHGLPKKIIAAGDPYQWQVEKTVELIVSKLDFTWDHAVCYQSKVGPLKWLEPSVDYELKRAAKDGKGVVIVPVAFVSEHSETLVELDIEYKKVSEEIQVPFYHRVPTVNDHEQFITGLAQMVLSSEKQKQLCPNEFKKCWCR